ncbi:hypothetical protein LAZ67_2007019 [Cordylochernes scorpioides]|uniref:RNase H type-1 domain-containing protein n=1 Tax=Cordylochernes scorpioides TaxID=51811 RepID=A0ABY6K6H4_9ARAC|nr:hypothetical protein LAZ67_2007019 [Cordylochernes scorpioides]
MLESAAKASASMLGTASNYRQSQTFTKVCLDHGAMINESCTPTPHSMRSDVDLHAASPVAQNKQGRVQDLGRGFCPISIIQSPQTSNFAASKQLRILQCNINGLCSTATKIKLEEIMEIAEKQKIQIIALQETKLNEKYNLKYKTYNILRKDRNKEGGGLAFLIKNLYYEDIAINIPNTLDLEAQGIKVYLSQNKTINIFNMYHPPNNKLIDDGTMAQFLTDNTIIVGDLNAKHQLWGCSMPNPRGKILSNLFDDNAFMCLNDGNPTHHSYSYNTAQALDISFSSPDIFHKCKWQILKSIGSDHLPILIEISTKTKTSSIKEKFWNFKKANWNLYQQNTNEDFRKAPTSIKDLEQNWISFKNTIIKAAKVSYQENTDGTPATNDKNAANLLGNSYQISSKIKFEIKDKKVEKKARKIIHDCKNITSTHNIFHEKINMKELDYALENTDLNKTPGPDGIHGQMISNLGKNGKERLLDIFNNSWKTGKLPQDWKTATIIPIKKLDKSADDPKNYRPISLTSICCKLMEKIILRRLTYHLDTKNLLPEEQYGFRKGHGTIDQLLSFTQKVKDAQNRKPTNHTIAAFLDLTQAFDKNRFPIHEDGAAAIPFVWNDVYTGTSSTMSNIKYEQACILYNIGALHSQLGAYDSREDAEGMKIACTHFQCAVWALQHLRDNYPQPRGSDMGFDLLSFFINIMLSLGVGFIDLTLLLGYSSVIRLKLRSVSWRSQCWTAASPPSQPRWPARWWTTTAWPTPSSPPSSLMLSAPATSRLHIILQDGTHIKIKEGAGKISSNFTCELTAIWKALDVCLNQPSLHQAEGIIIYSHSRSALEAIQKGNTRITQKIHSLLTQLETLEKNCILQWIPAHVGIEGNEMADELAKEARKLSQRKEQMSVFDADALAKYKIIKKKKKKDQICEINSERKLTKTITRLRTKHYKGMTIHPDGTRTYKACNNCPGVELTPTHIFSCPAMAAALQKIYLDPEQQLYTPKIVDIAAAVMEMHGDI